MAKKTVEKIKDNIVLSLLKIFGEWVLRIYEKYSNKEDSIMSYHSLAPTDEAECFSPLIGRTMF